MKISGDINIYPLKIPNFSPAWHAPPSQVVFLLSTLAPKWAAFTLNICTRHCTQISHTCSTSKFHLNMLQYSTWGDVMLNAISYGMDCTCPKFMLAGRPWITTCIDFTPLQWLRADYHLAPEKYKSDLRRRFTILTVRDTKTTLTSNVFIENDRWSFASAAARVSESKCKYKSIRWLNNQRGAQLYFSGWFTLRFLPVLRNMSS